MIKDQMERIYSNVPLDEIPWNIESTPEILIELLETGMVASCKALDAGCGTGNYAVYLAGRGFEVTGIDISPSAIEIAKKNASSKGVECDFIVADVLGDLKEVNGTFDFVYDWQLMHHIFPLDRERYINHIHRLLNPGGQYLSVCFSEESPQFGGEGKYRKTPLDTMLYFSSESEMISLFKPLFDIRELKTIDIEGKFGSHRAIYALLGKQ